MRDGSGSTLSIRVRPRDHDDNDGFRAEETVVYHWDRIFAALGLLALIIFALAGGLWYWLQEDGESTAEHAQPPTTLSMVEPISAPPASDATEDQPRDSVTAEVIEPSLTAPADEPEQDTVDPATPGPTPAIVAQSLAEVEILSDHLHRAQLTRDLDRDRRPVGYAPAIIPMNTEGLIRVWLYTEMEGLQGKTVHHDWYLGDERTARVTIHPRADSMRASSSKFIDRHMLGQWRVEVHTADGEPLARSEFEVH